MRLHMAILLPARLYYSFTSTEPTRRHCIVIRACRMRTWAKRQTGIGPAIRCPIRQRLSWLAFAY
ncbi:hypothetical protein FOQG_19063 [Fusarium oxysporum f. sp. raphani 54005]|uniref:Uncharacterized protein n=1 Tax=Fusarium oxysporum f. sp. raphani 54005 TaxID=1089458 RepID=X0B384_FUSOX|nr:hypothetical protein FOQG_19063 [Fusarium oxysporum f. sp. raphani 54005]